MSYIIYDESKLTEMMDRIVKRTMKMDLTWEWPGGVAYYGVCAVADASGRDEYYEMLKKTIDEYIEIGIPKKWTVNSCAMGHCILSLYMKYGDEVYLDIVRSKLKYLSQDAERFGEGVLQHTVSSSNDFPEQAWADTLFMAALFMLRAGVLLKDESLIEDALNQWYWHIRFLQNKESGLWYHGYNNINKNNMSGVYWGRANAWAAYTMSQVSGILPKCYLYPKFMDVAGSLNEQLASIKLLQTENGMWRTILDDEDSYEEISASCGIAAAMVAKKNPLHIKYINRFINGFYDNVSSDGRVLNVSGGTAVMNDRDGYRNISRDWIQGWGQGLALSFIAELLKTESDPEGGAL